MRSPAGKLRIDNRMAAARARRPFFAVNLQKGLVRPFLAVAADKVAYRRAAMCHSLPQHDPIGLVEAVAFVGAYITAAALGPDAGKEQRLVGVNITQAGYAGLIEQKGFDGTLRRLEGLLQIGKSKFVAVAVRSQRIVAGNTRRPLRRHEPQAPEGADVAIQDIPFI